MVDAPSPEPVPDRAAPPGWYPDGSAYLRWWDGQRWGPWAPPPGPTPPSPSDERTWGMLAHLGFVAGGFVLPLVILVIYKDRSRFLRHHAAEALNFQIAYFVVNLAGVALTVVGIAVSAATETPWGFLPFPLIFLAIIANMALSIVGAVRAHHGIWWRYPVSIRLVPGAVGTDEHLPPIPAG